VPSYTELSRIISLAINSQKQDILERLLPFIKDEKLNVLDEFLQKDTSTKNRWHKKIHQLKIDGILHSIKNWNMPPIKRR